MNRDDILAVLGGLEGVQIPGRGVDADDALFGRYRTLDAHGRSAFWGGFAAALRQLWDATDVDGFESAAVFVARLSGADQPTEEQARPVGEFLLTDPLVTQEPATMSADVRRRVVAALRLLVALGAGDRRWWSDRFRLWKAVADQSPDAVEDSHAWQALLHASRGLMAHGQPIPNFDAWFDAAWRAKDFPAIEVFTVLAEQAQRDPRKDELLEGVIDDFQALHLLCGNGTTCPQGIEALRSVIETWLVDRMGQKVSVARRRLKPNETRTETPWEIVHRPLGGQTPARP